MAIRGCVVLRVGIARVCKHAAALKDRRRAAIECVRVEVESEQGLGEDSAAVALRPRLAGKLGDGLELALHVRSHRVDLIDWTEGREHLGLHVGTGGTEGAQAALRALARPREALARRCGLKQRPLAQ